MKINSAHTLHYKGWQISVFSNDDHVFSVLPPGGGEPLSDCSPHTSLRAALKAARSFINGRIVRNEVGAIFDDMVEQGQLDPRTHTYLLIALAENAQSQLLE